MALSLVVLAIVVVVLFFLLLLPDGCAIAIDLADYLSSLQHIISTYKFVWTSMEYNYLVLSGGDQSSLLHSFGSSKYPQAQAEAEEVADGLDDLPVGDPA